MNKKHTKSLNRSAVILFTVLLASCSKEESSLVGCWQRTDDKALECWEAVGDSLVGKGMAPDGHGDTTVFETLQLYWKDGVRIYAAKVGQNEEPILFRETTPWTFENPEHDFPRKISYEFEADSVINVTVGGGEGIGFTWRFRKLPQSPN